MREKKHREVRMPISRRALASTAAFAIVAASLPRRAGAAYPERPIRIIVPFPPGGALDGVARLLGKALTDNIGAAAVVDNRGGAGGIIGMEAVAHAAPDGYTLLLSHNGLAAMPGLYRDLPFDPVHDFAGIVTAASGAYVLVANPHAPFKSVAELIAYAKANPGKITYASAGIGSTVHLASEFFKRMAAIDLLHVPYKGAAQATTDVVGGQVDMMFAPVIASLPLANAGQLVALAVTSAKRSAIAPNLPTVAESGVPGFEVTGWYGLAAPAATPMPAIMRLNTEVNRALMAGGLIEQLHVQGLEPVGGPPEEARSRLASEVVRWSRIIREAGIKAQ
jgi:tripartite-type tricarboxylate transporter receptor subunit TctC